MNGSKRKWLRFYRSADEAGKCPGKGYGRVAPTVPVDAPRHVRDRRGACFGATPFDAKLRGSPSRPMKPSTIAAITTVGEPTAAPLRRLAASRPFLLEFSAKAMLSPKNDPRPCDSVLGARLAPTHGAELARHWRPPRRGAPRAPPGRASMASRFDTSVNSSLTIRHQIGIKAKRTNRAGGSQ